MSSFNLQAIALGLAVMAAVFFGRMVAPAPSLAQPFNQTVVATSVQNGEAMPSAAQPFGEMPPVRVKAAVVKRLGAGYAAYQAHTNERWPIASLTKLMTAVIALEHFPTSQIISFDDTIVATEGNSGGFQAGESFSVRDTVQALMLVSSNDAAMALATAYGYQKFVDEMQIKANELGMRQTTFFDPTGLSFLNQSTIDDLEKLVAYVWEEHRDILRFSQLPQALLGNRVLVNINEFAGQPNFLGGKTGYTDDANGNLISLFQDPGQNEPLLIIVFGTDDRFGETRKLYQFAISNLQFSINK